VVCDNEDCNVIADATKLQDPT